MQPLKKHQRIVRLYMTINSKNGMVKSEEKGIAIGTGTWDGQTEKRGKSLSKGELRVMPQECADSHV